MQIATTADFKPRADVTVELRSELQAEGRRLTFAKGRELFGEGDCPDFFYKVTWGTVRISKQMNDGRRQIDSFQLAGDIFGLERGDGRRFTAEAVEDTSVIAFQRSCFDRLVRDSPPFRDHLILSMLVSLDRAHDHMALLRRKTPPEKIATFLLDMACRLRKFDCFDLPMHRADIADYLGLAKETVSRTLTQMDREGLITLAVTGRTIILNDRAGLRQLNA
jgi:CRP/FNR family nitrogen fixation transcriptional regulator